MPAIKLNQMVKNQERSLDLTFSALSDSTRRRILRSLAEGERTVGELARPFRISLPAVSRHLRVLERAGLLVQTRRGRERFCRVVPRRLEEANGWIESYRKFWTARLDALDAFLKQQAPDEEKSK